DARAAWRPGPGRPSPAPVWGSAERLSPTPGYRSARSAPRSLSARIDDRDRDRLARLEHFSVEGLRRPGRTLPGPSAHAEQQAEGDPLAGPALHALAQGETGGAAQQGHQMRRISITARRFFPARRPST